MTAVAPSVQPAAPNLVLPNAGAGAELVWSVSPAMAEGSSGADPDPATSPAGIGSGGSRVHPSKLVHGASAGDTSAGLVVVGANRVDTTTAPTATTAELSVGAATSAAAADLVLITAEPDTGAGAISEQATVLSVRAFDASATVSHVLAVEPAGRPRFVRPATIESASELVSSNRLEATDSGSEGSDAIDSGGGGSDAPVAVRPGSHCAEASAELVSPVWQEVVGNNDCGIGDGSEARILFRIVAQLTPSCTESASNGVTAGPAVAGDFSPAPSAPSSRSVTAVAPSVQPTALNPPPECVVGVVVHAPRTDSRKKSGSAQPAPVLVSSIQPEVPTVDAGAA